MILVHVLPQMVNGQILVLPLSSVRIVLQIAKFVQVLLFAQVAILDSILLEEHHVSLAKDCAQSVSILLQSVLLVYQVTIQLVQAVCHVLMVVKLVLSHQRALYVSQERIFTQIHYAMIVRKILAWIHKKDVQTVLLLLLLNHLTPLLQKLLVSYSKLYKQTLRMLKGSELSFLRQTSFF